MTKKQTLKRFNSPAFLALRVIGILGLLLCFSACEQQPEFEEGEGTNTDTGGGSGSGGGGGSTDVGGSGNASANISWDIPSVRENGDELSLSEIAGYEIVYHLVNDPVYSVITIEDNNTSSHTINNLRAGNYEFMIAVFDTEGLYSDYSDPVLASLSGN